MLASSIRDQYIATGKRLGEEEADKDWIEAMRESGLTREQIEGIWWRKTTGRPYNTGEEEGPEHLSR